jgi:glycine/D-amino acid oxidase-like deaminating enzyme
VTSADCVVIGGGFSGLLTALGLSRNPSLRVILVEAESKPGGRLLFSPREGGEPEVRLNGDGHRETSAAFGAGAPLATGFPLEILASGAVDLWRTCQLLLTADEWPIFCADTAPNEPLVNAPPPRPVAYVVKKEWTAASDLLSGPSECLTRKGAAHLWKLLDLGTVTSASRSEAAGALPMPVETTVLRDAPFWKSLSKAEKDELRPFLETVAGSEFEKANCSELKAALRFLSDADARSHRPKGADEAQPSLSRLEALGLPDTGKLARALVRVLRARGVILVFGAAVQGVRREAVPHEGVGAENYVCSLQSSDPQLQTLVAPRVCVCVPLARALLFLPREYLSPQESRFTMRVRPRSLIALELLVPHKVPSWQTQPAPGALAQIVFPVERVLAVRTASDPTDLGQQPDLPNGRFIFYAWLDYEVSLQAPGVREVLGRIKRAFNRVFPDCDLGIFARRVGKRGKVDGAKGALGAEPKPVLDLGEKLVLIPVAQTVPLDADPLPPSVGAAGSAGLHLVGDHFSGFSGSLASVCASSLAAARAVAGDPIVSSIQAAELGTDGA